MEKIKVELFVSSTCPHCPRAERAVKAAIRGLDYIEFNKIRTSTREGKEKAIERRVMGVPALFINEKIWKGSIEENKVRRYLEELKNPSKKKSLLSKLFNI